MLSILHFYYVWPYCNNLPYWFFASAVLWPLFGSDEDSTMWGRRATEVSKARLFCAQRWLCRHCLCCCIIGSEDRLTLCMCRKKGGGGFWTMSYLFSTGCFLSAAATDWKQPRQGLRSGQRIKTHSWLSSVRSKWVSHRQNLRTLRQQMFRAIEKCYLPAVPSRDELQSNFSESLRVDKFTTCHNSLCPTGHTQKILENCIEYDKWTNHPNTLWTSMWLDEFHLRKLK